MRGLHLELRNGEMHISIRVEGVLQGNSRFWLDVWGSGLVHKQKCL
jgi:hypothetical protein